MGFETPLFPVFDFIYKADFENGLTEYEFDHVLAGEYDGPVYFNPDEVMDFSFRSLTEIRQGIETRPDQYTAWFPLAFPKIFDWWRLKYGQ